MHISQIPYLMQQTLRKVQLLLKGAVLESVHFKNKKKA